MLVSNIHKAKTHFSDLINKVLNGEDVVICKSGQPIVRLIKYEKLLFSRKSGVWKGKVFLSDDFDESTPELLHLFYGNK